jgi:UDP-N-acetylglucosamine 2-epimerase (non-hydrolysing)
VHLNPNVREPVSRLLKGIEKILLIEPQQYLPFIYLMNRSQIILTDAGAVKLVGANPALILKEISRLVDNEAAYKAISFSHNPYDDGKSCQRILVVLAASK